MMRHLEKVEGVKEEEEPPASSDMQRKLEEEEIQLSSFV